MGIDCCGCCCCWLLAIIGLPPLPLSPLVGMGPAAPVGVVGLSIMFCWNSAIEELEGASLVADDWSVVAAAAVVTSFSSPKLRSRMESTVAAWN